ncbi:MAG: hypothetical protein ACK4VI_03885 [Alphaproteobacteria bacterium]
MSMSVVKPTLITAFKPWGNIAANLTQQIVEEMEGELSQIGNGVSVAVLDVRYEAVDAFSIGWIPALISTLSRWGSCPKPPRPFVLKPRRGAVILSLMMRGVRLNFQIDQGLIWRCFLVMRNC